MENSCTTTTTTTITKIISHHLAFDEINFGQKRNETKRNETNE